MAAKRRARYALLRLRHGETEAEPVTEVNIIPVIDISLVLLVILFVTAPLLSVPNVPVELPRGTAPQDQEESISVTYTREGALTIRSADSDWERLKPALASELARRPNAAVVLRIDKAVPYRLVQRLMKAAQDAGAAKIAFGTEPPR